MMFSKQDLGNYFKEDNDSKVVQSSAATKSNSNIPRMPLKASDLRFEAATGAKHVGRYWAGKAPEQAQEDDDDDGLLPAHLGRPSLATSVSAAGNAAGRHVNSETAEYSGGVDSVVVGDSVAPRRRAVFEAEVLPSGDDSETRTRHDSPRSSDNQNATNNNDDDDPDERRRRIRERLAARQRAEAVVVADESVDSVDRVPRDDGGSAGARAESSAVADDQVEGDVEVQRQPAAQVDDDAAARRARIRDRLRARKAEDEGRGAAEAQVISSASGGGWPGGSSGNGGVTVEGVTLKLTGTLAARRPVEAGVISSSAVSAEQHRDNAEEVDEEAAGEEASDEGEEEEESSEEDEETTAWNFGRKLYRPVWRGKEERSTLREAEAKAAEEEKAKLEVKKAAAKRAEESRRMVAETLQREDAEATAVQDGDDDGAKPDDTDRPEDEEKEFEEWRLRELRRVKREAETAAQAAFEIAETERRRKLTPEERAREDRLLEAQGLKVFRKQKEKLNFLQKYYHKGAFYVDEDTVKDKDQDVRARSAAGATELEAFDRAALPEVMQVKKFGMRGQTKWKHLTAEDTTAFDAYHKDAGSSIGEGLRRKLEQSRGGAKGGL